jgi:hypothetical protein
MEAKARAMKAVVCALCAASILVIARGARADERPVVVGEVGTRVARAGVDLRGALRSALERELAALDIGTTGRAKRWVLSASVVKLEGRRAGAGVECAVSVVVREKKSGAIRAVLSGRAETDAEGSDAVLAVLDAAVRGAVAAVPAAVR